MKKTENQLKQRVFVSGGKKQTDTKTLEQMVEDKRL